MYASVYLVSKCINGQHNLWELVYIHKGKLKVRRINGIKDIQKTTIRIYMHDNIYSSASPSKVLENPGLVLSQVTILFCRAFI